jgi:acetyltransferase-like isoleucine patch superfamily enzyme
VLVNVEVERSCRIAEGVLAAARGSIVVKGAASSLVIGEPLDIGDIRLEVQDGASLEIAPGCVLGDVYIHARAGARIAIGGATGFVGRRKLLAHERATILVGESCLFADEVLATVSDMHAIVDLASGTRINPARDIFIDRHVWVGQRVLIMKGARIGPETIVGAGSIVLGELPAQSICVGSPAKPIRHGVSWRFALE